MKRPAFILFNLVIIIRIAFAQCTPDATISPAGPVNICAGNSVTLSAPPGNVWTKMTDLAGVERQNAVGFSVGTKGYIGTGRNASATVYSDLWEYDPANDTWTQKADFGGGQRWGAVGFGIGNKGYVGTGRLGAASFNDFWEYSPVSNTWTSRAAFTGTARFLAVGFSIGAKGYIGTGWDGTSRFTDFREYDPATNAWTNRAAFTGASRHSAVGFSVGTKGYIGTGSVSIILNETDFYEYNPATNTWAAKLDFPAAGRYGATGFGIGTKGFLGTGFDGTSYYNDFYEYNPASNTWTARASYSAPACRYAVGFSIDDKGYIGTGLNGTTLYKQFWEYYPACTYSWSSGQTTQSISASTAGSYTVTVTAVTGCSATSEPTIVTQSVINPVISPGGTVNICSGNNTVLTAGANQDVWTLKADFGGTARSYAVGFSIGPKGYIGTGDDGTNRKDFWEYDPSTNAWTQKADFGGTARTYAVGFSIGSKGYIGTGSDGTSKKDFWEYNPATNTWTQKADFGGAARSFAVGFCIGSKGYVGTGRTNVFTKDFWEYNPATDTWTRKTDFGGTMRIGAIGFSIGNKGYIGTGYDNFYKNDFWEYGPATDTWTQKSDFGGMARRDAVGFSIGSKGYMGTGNDALGYFKDFWEYDPSTNTWIQKADFGGTSRRLGACFSIGAKGFIGTGDDGASKKDFWQFGPDYTYSWSSGETTQSITASTAGNYTVTVTDIFGCSATSAPTTVIVNSPTTPTITPSGPTTFCSGGNVSLIATGSYYWKQKADFGGSARFGAVGFSIGSKGYIGTGSDGANKKDFWEYDPATNAWSQKADFGGTARQGAVGFSIATKGYIGTGNDGTNKKDFWEYNPATNTWTPKAGFGGTARSYSVGFSIGIKGYIGTGNDGTNKRDFWEYDPFSNGWTQKTDFGGTARNYAVGFSIGTKGYIGTGNDGSLKKDFWEYDPATNTWLQRSDFGGTARLTPIGFSLGSKGYIVTGNDGTRRKDFWEFDPATNSWFQQADFTGSGRTYGIGFTIGNRAYIGTGQGATNFNDFWEYNGDYTYSWSSGETTQSITASTAGSYTVTVTDGNVCSATSAPASVTVIPLPSTTITPSGPTTFCAGGNVNLTVPGTAAWTRKADFGGGVRLGAVGFSIGNKGYIGTGNNSVTSMKDFWEYDPVINAWTQKTDFGGVARTGAVGFSIGGKGYLGTGNNGSTYMKDFWEYDPATNVWTPKADFGGGFRFEAVGLSIGSKGYIGTGLDPITTMYKKDFWEYDPATDTWTPKTDFGGVARSEAVGFSIGTKGYVGTGGVGGGMKDFWEYNPLTNTWLRMSDFGGVARSEAVGFNIGSKGYIGTGDYNGTTYTRDFWEYDPTINTWTQKIDVSSDELFGAVGFSISGKGYIGTGFASGYLNYFYEYDPTGNLIQWSDFQTTPSITASTSGSYTVTVTDSLGCSATSPSTIINVSPLPTAVITPGGPTTFCVGGNVNLTAQITGGVWTKKADFLGTARLKAVGFSIGSKGYIGTGKYGVAYMNDFWEYDPSTNTWTQKANFGGTARAGAVGFGIGTNGYIGTGNDGLKRKDFWEYNPASNTWTAKTNFPGTAREDAVGFSMGTNGYIGTGIDAGGVRKNDFWEYDPATNTWTAKTNFPGTARSGATAFSIGTKGYVGTGNLGVSNVNDFWEYDPVTNAWTQKTNFGGIVRKDAVSFSISSKGYIGTGDFGSMTRDFWEYDPATDAWTQKTNFGGSYRGSAVGFSIGSKGYIGFGIGNNAEFQNDFWEYDQSSYTYLWSTGATTPSITPDTSGTFTVAVTDILGCSGSSAPTVINVSTINTWAGGGTNNWNTASNWSCGSVPNNPQVTAVINNGAVPMPVLTADVLVKSLALNGTSTVDINGQTLTINKNITGTGKLKGSATSNLILKGAAGTVSFASGFNTLKDLLLTDTASATLGSALNIAAGASPGSVTVNSNAVLNTGGNLTLKSDVSGTARVGILTGNIIGDVTVERYINTGTTGGAHTKTWQFLATPTTGQTIRQAWQENGTTPAGFGTIITGTGTGFDITTALPSMKFFNDVAVNWTAITNTNNALLNKLGYMLFVRGDRTVTTSGANPNNTVLRSKGTLFQPSNPPASVAVAANKFQTFGNPYASRIEFSKVRAVSTGINDVFYVWDPKLAGSYNVGGYQTITGLAGYVPTVGTPPTGNPATVYYPAGVPAPFIESGQAVFVKGNGTGGNVNFNETVKAAGSRLVNRPGNGNNDLASRGFIFASLFTNTDNIADGNIVAFEEGLGNELNTLDALKIMNGGENFGIRRSDSLLAVEARDQVKKNDTIFYHLQNLKKLPYQFRFAPVNMSREGLQAYLIDRFNNSSTDVSLTDSCFINFTITEDVRSQAADRFILVFKKAKKGSVKPSTPKEASEQARGQNKEIIETKPTVSSIAVYPNPVVGQQINIRFSNMAKGNYRIELSNKQGQVVYKGEKYIDKQNTTHTIKTNSVLASGSYQLSVVAEDGERMVESVVVK